jgi:hypothetical protein
MASPEVLSLAKKGDPVAIATLMNQVTQPRGISVRVKAQEDCLHLLFEAEQIPKQTTAVSFVRSSLDILKINTLKTAMVYGRQQGNHHTSWHETVQLQPLFEMPAAPISESLPEESPSVEPETREETDNDRSIPSNPHVTDLTPSASVISDIEPVSSLRQNLSAEAIPIEATPVMETSSSLVKQPDAFLAERSTPDYLKRPEAVVFVAFATMMLFWEAYLALLDELAPETSLSCRQLAERLKVSKKTVRHRKRQEGFGEWSQSLDPEGIAWVYQSGGLYAPKI